MTARARGTAERRFRTVSPAGMDSVSATLRIPVDLSEKIGDIARAKGISKNEYILQCVRLIVSTTLPPSEY